MIELQEKIGLLSEELQTKDLEVTRALAQVDAFQAENGRLEETNTQYKD